SLLRHTIEIKRRVPGDNHPGTAVTKYNLAVNLVLSGRRAEAVAELRDSVQHGLASAFARGIEKDPDFRKLQDVPDFKALVAEIREHTATASKPLSVVSSSE